MNYLLDTQVFIWVDSDPAKISIAAHHIMADANNLYFLSIASVWELLIKHQLGKLKLRAPLPDIIHDQENNVRLLPITTEHIFTLEQLPMLHRDPFDRLRIAQALSEGMTLISSDSTIALYNLPLIW
jgi:PIN domain nuclease of toxin-antitoxin system